MKAELLGDIPTASIDWERWNQGAAWIEYLWIFAKICHFRFDSPELQNQAWIKNPVSQIFTTFTNFIRLASLKPRPLCLIVSRSSCTLSWRVPTSRDVLVVNTSKHQIVYICTYKSSVIFCRIKIAWPWIEGSALCACSAINPLNTHAYNLWPFCKYSTEFFSKFVSKKGI